MTIVTIHEGVEELDTILTLSTGHIAASERSFLDSTIVPQRLAQDHNPNRPGYWTGIFWVNQDEGFGGDNPYAREAWPTLAAVHDYADNLGCRYFRLDPDGPAQPNLPTYD